MLSWEHHSSVPSPTSQGLRLSLPGGFPTGISKERTSRQWWPQIPGRGGISLSSSSPSSSLSFPIFVSARVHAGRDRSVIDGIEGYQSAIEQTHSLTAAQVLPAAGRERSVFREP